MKVVVTDFAWANLQVETEILEAVGAELVAARTGETPALVALVADADAIMVNWSSCPAEVLAAAANCKVVARYGVGVDNIDVARATELGIVVTNVPDFCVDEVAEHALALIFALRRKIVAFALATRAGEWDNTAFDPLHRMRGQTIGLVGAGLLARGLAQRARGLGLEVIAYSRSSTPGATENGMTFTGSLGELLERSDIVSLHVPLTAETSHLIGAAQLERMKRSAILINTSRGGVVDLDALTAALAAGEIAGVGLDVTEPEPIDPSHPLLRMENAIITPHAAFYSVEATVDLQTRATENVRDVLVGATPRTIVNREVLTSGALRAVALRGG